MEYYLAIDIGASSGRHILGYSYGGRLVLKEIYRFENALQKNSYGLCWDVDRLEFEVTRGIKECSSLGIVPRSIAIDTWGVDYVLLDGDRKPIMPVFSYRDARTGKTVGEVESIVSASEMYKKTGIQKLDFNTVYQLYSDKLSGRLDRAEHFLMIPEYLSYRLTGVIRNEYTNATTTGLVNAAQKKWDKELIKKLGYPERLFGELCFPTCRVGNFTKDVAEYVGFDTEVVLGPSHDTASAVLGCPLEKDGMYVSSGTWSLIGCELDLPVLSEAAREANFTNEGGYDCKFRFLKNYMGMWLLQGIRRDLGKKYTYDEMMNMASECSTFSYIDVNDARLTAPENMIEAVKTVAGKKEMTLPEVLNSVYHSLARSYKYAVGEIQRLTRKPVRSIFIVGGGGSDKYLNRLTAQYTGLKVYAGIKEATAIGNIVSQMMRNEEGLDTEQARARVKKSFNIWEIEDEQVHRSQGNL